MRYSRQQLLPEVGVLGQERLQQARVLCVGAGGLGSPLLLYLAGAGVGTLGIVDHDVVEISNLHRQIMFRMQDLAVKKVIAARNKIEQLNPNVSVEFFDEKLSLHNVQKIISKYDIIADCTDNFTARYLINDTCFYLKKPNVSASIYQFEGQCSVFTNSNGPCYRCLYPEASTLPSCAESGVLGVLPGMLGTIQATEILKWILKIGSSLSGRLLTVDARLMHFREFLIEKHSHCVLCSENAAIENIIYPEDLCMTETIPEISIQELAEWQTKGEDFVLLDVREPHEYAEVEMGGTLIPIGELPNRLSELDPLKKTIVHCRGGGRSKRGVEILKNAGFIDARNLTGGITAWI
ncbi:MAG TPA: molybdopterin-synthase adenylyltransferase MoeB, partial [Gammaproteobacteria bacterium]|nr:molybdopterin-synthase adenylyltransferase MoeB [Gammaproteobacteria bacterium]